MFMTVRPNLDSWATDNFCLKWNVRTGTLTIGSLSLMWLSGWSAFLTWITYDCWGVTFVNCSWVPEPEMETFKAVATEQSEFKADVAMCLLTFLFYTYLAFTLLLIVGVYSLESEIFFFLIVVIMFRTRKHGGRTLLTYVSTASMYAKTCNVILWFGVDAVKGCIYIALILVHLLVCGEPVYDGPENVIYFDATGPKEELKKDKQTVWVLCFYTSWSPSCGRLAPIFSRLSVEYNLENLKFGKVDVGRYPALAREYHINNTAISLQLPTIAVYRGDEELLRRPCLDSKGKFQKFYFTEDNIKAAFDLTNLYLECKKQSKTGTLSDKKTD